MSSSAEAKFASIFGPMAAAENTTGGTANNVIRRPTSSTATSEPLDADTLADGRPVVQWAGKFVTVKNEDMVNPLDFAYSTGAVTLVYDQLGTFTAGSAVAGWRLGPGESISEMVPLAATHANWVQPGSAPAAKISFRCSQNESGNK